ncbi:MAG: serine/threonine protein kinase [Planctomycetes bacterium]|nr:serine/threonine protein kinase [Planctomycetota bacterium]
MIDWESFYAAFRRPDFIPGYEVQNHLGGGAFGEVYKARKSSIGKAFAIKFLRIDDSVQREAVERELEQVRLFAAIDHPNLVTIEDMGVVQGVPYLIMGYAGEDTLARRLKRADLERDSALRFFVQVARGVLALHDRRLAHFDLKPSNVFLNGDVARVGDYGLAKLLVEGRATLSFGRGTPHYMAPEMLRNRADHRADLYSLGVILFESLSFRLPYGTDAGGAFVVREDDRPPEFPSGFPSTLRPVVERCLRLDPAQRYASVHELLSELGQTARQGDSVRLSWNESASAARPPEAGRLGAWPETPRSAAAARANPSAVPSTGASAAKEELRGAAAELARGAVGVARGVWDGVVAEVASARGNAPDAPAAPSLGVGDDGSEVLVIHSLEESGAEEGVVSSAALSALDAPWRAELRRAREAEAALAPASTALASALETVPVPPRAEGGFLGSVVQSLVVGAEIMGALVTGPVMVFGRRSAHAFDRTVRGLPVLLGGVVRLLLFLGLMALIGAVSAFVLLAALALDA